MGYVLAYGALALAGVGLLYQLFALGALGRFFAAPPAAHAPAQAVTILKPLHGAEPRLAENLDGFTVQDYPAPVQIVLGTNTPEDGAAPVARALIAAHDNIAYYPGPRAPESKRAAANGKVGSLIAMMPLAAHDVLVLSDSDMVVAPDYLMRINDALAQPGVGAVSCLYVGRGDAGLWSRVGAMMIAGQTLPNMVVGLVTGMAQPCMGSTIALRRETLDAMGGFEALADVLADDHAIGAGVRAQGLRVDIPPMILVHAGAESSLRALWRQHLRWAVTVRDLAGAGHYGSIVTHGLPLGVLAAVLAPGIGGALLLAIILVRLALAAKVHKYAPITLPLWLIPLADLIGFCVFCASLFATAIDWRGASLTMTSKGRIAARTKRDR
ncbi:ceramide glucosyltransferase [Novosphingobium sp. SG751A]|uniref:bacteriohopanetetrol glucosamine biosynthesis glycosyltransferase HpnI n=1 Tax=Novosphingobium sp. SG751A TaxID=2587000 RepID=UPI0015573BFE|nr:bacteriohopanetetrol glucosamine biosynthesis glycosyltransferase HpnI [Novosphingobium sp. SG751A]NOW46250.1 ceramide glucosyltransferase [Novosphingobium sp. SG751A]